jgi:hypothetical protein
MNKPVIELKEIMYQHHEPSIATYPVFVVNGDGTEGSFSQLHLYCTGCGRGHSYRFVNQEGPLFTYKCPKCNTVSLHFEELNEEE